MNNLSNRPQNKNIGQRSKEYNHRKYLKNIEAYNVNPKLCENCSNPLLYNRRVNRFCSKHCSGMYNNQGRSLSDEHKAKTSQSLRIHYESRPKKAKPLPKLKKVRSDSRTRLRHVKYPFSRVRPCKQCKRFMINHQRIYCDTCYPNISLYRTRCKFLFNIYEYPSEFPLQLIELHGWYSPGGNRKKNKNLNMTGVSRDHMFSINDGFKADIRPDLLAHPANCQLLLHSENNKKKSKSSLTLIELKERIHLWEDKYER